MALSKIKRVLAKAKGLCGSCGLRAPQIGRVTCKICIDKTVISNRAYRPIKVGFEKPHFTQQHIKNRIKKRIPNDQLLDIGDCWDYDEFY